MKKRSLLIHNPDGSTGEFALEKATVKIGRAPDNDLVLLDNDRSVSRWHAAITSDESRTAIADLNSSNGTVVNGRRINLHVDLAVNDVIKIGQFQLTVQDQAAADDPRFRIQVGSVGLEVLQKEPTLLPVDRDSGLKSLELLYAVGVKLARSHSVEEVTEAAVELLFRIDEVHRAAVILWDQEAGKFGNMGLRLRSGGKAGSLPSSFDPANVVMSRTILNRVRRENVPLLIRDAKAEAMLDDNSSIIRAGIQAAFCAPLTFQGQFLGIIYADNLAEPDAFSENDFRAFANIASQTGLALANVLASQRLQQRETERQVLRQYLPPQVADMILASGGASQLRGVLQPVTVLYADIRGFTTISEQMEASEIVEMLSEFFTVMSLRILGSNGTLDKFIGDCIMALFGAPVAAPTAPRDGVRAAIAMQRAMQTLKAERMKRNAVPFDIGIGLHCGPAVVGNIGSSDRVQYTAIGDTVNVASRLVGKASAGQIIVSEDIRAKVPDSGFDPLGEVELKGRTGLMPIHAVRWTDIALD